jgi:hypothetical protein
MKLIIKDKLTIIVLLLSIVIFAIVIQSLSASAEELSALPIGVIDNDQSDSSRSLIQGLNQVETLRMVQGNEIWLKKQLLDEMIISYIVINQGYEERIRAGNAKEIITLYYKKDNKAVSILSDIIAGEMIYPISLQKSLAYYERLPHSGNKRSAEQYQSYMDDLLVNSQDIDFAFQINYTNPKQQTSGMKPITNALLYNQFIIGILGMMIAFIAMFLMSQTVREKEMGVEVRLRVTGMNLFVRDVGNQLAIIIVEGFLALLYATQIAIQLNMKDWRMWLSIFILICCNSLALGVLMLFITKVLQRIQYYQILASVLILVSGGLGFYQLISGFYSGNTQNIIKIIPNSWFIQGFTDIILYGNTQGYFNRGHLGLIMISGFLIFLVIGMNILLRLTLKKDNKIGW